MRIARLPQYTPCMAKADEAVPTRLAGHGIGDDLSRLARGEAELKLRYENEIINLGTS